MALRRAVVTGGAGFLGSHLCERLVDDGWDVLALDNFCTGTPENLAHLVERDTFRLVRTDVTDYLHVGGPVDLVLHFASPASPIDYLQLPVETLKVGSIGTLHALGLAREKGARFVLASTSETYGDPQVHPQPETYWGHVNPVGPRGVYDEAKRFGEALTMAYRRTMGVNTGIVRIFNTFGPRMRPFDGRAIPTFIRQALSGQPITVAGDGSQTRSVCYVDDLVEGILRLAGTDHPGPVNIGNPHELSVLALAELIRDLCESDVDISFIPRPEDDPSVRQPDISLARELLEWSPRVTIEDGLRRTVEWFATHPDVWGARLGPADQELQQFAGKAPGWSPAEPPLRLLPPGPPRTRRRPPEPLRQPSRWPCWWPWSRTTVPACCPAWPARCRPG
jgi:dTDP-glucose 4,6-dehydratase